MFALYMKTKNFHWHMSGPYFRDFHLLLDDQAARYGDFDDLSIVGVVDQEWPERSRRNIFYPPALLKALGWPSEKDRANHFEIAIPRLGSLVLTHSLDGEVKGLDEFRDHPPVAPLFFAFRIMVGTGMLMLAASWFAL